MKRAGVTPRTLEQPKRYKVTGGHAHRERTEDFSDAILRSSDGQLFPVHRLVCEAREI